MRYVQFDTEGNITAVIDAESQEPRDNQIEFPDFTDTHGKMVDLETLELIDTGHGIPPDSPP